MHKHHGTVRLMIIMICLVLVGLAVYFVLAYGLARTMATQQTTSSTGVYFPVTASATSTIATSTSSSTPSGTATSTSWEQGMTVVTNTDNSGTVQLSKNERFVVQLGTSLNWNLTFDPATGITRVPNSTTADGIQGIYEADEVGTTTLHATGAPICKAHQACPDFLEEVTVTFVVE